jgi:hypothetical protein
MGENLEKRNYWLQHIQALQESGLIRRAYCEQNQVKLATLGYWCQKFNSSAKSKRQSENGWIPVHIREEEHPDIDLRIGRVNIAVKPGFDPLLLADVLRTMNAVC